MSGSEPPDAAKNSFDACEVYRKQDESAGEHRWEVHIVSGGRTTGTAYFSDRAYGDRSASFNAMLVFLDGMMKEPYSIESALSAGPPREPDADDSPGEVKLYFVASLPPAKSILA